MCASAYHGDSPHYDHRPQDGDGDLDARAVPEDAPVQGEDGELDKDDDACVC